MFAGCALHTLDRAMQLNKSARYSQAWKTHSKFVDLLRGNSAGTRIPNNLLEQPRQ